MSTRPASPVSDVYLAGHAQGYLVERSQLRPARVPTELDETRATVPCPPSWEALR
jgi:hypothetical protein